MNNKKYATMNIFLIAAALCVSPLLFQISAEQNPASVYRIMPLTTSPDVIAMNSNLADVPARNLSGAEPAANTEDRRITLHQILGYTTLGMVAATFATGAIIPEKGHCALSYVATALSTVTCIHGYYEYGSMINFTDGELKYNVHAVVGTVATAGFLASCLLAGEDGDKSHITVGAASGVAYAISMVTLFF